LFTEVARIPPEGLQIDRALSLGPVVQANGEPAPVEAVVLSGSFRRADSDVVFRGRVAAVVSLSCSRCLAPFRLEVAGDCSRIYRPGPLGPRPGEGELKDEDLALTPFDGVRIPLEEIAEEQIYLMIPLKPLCRESCSGLCPHCGADRNQVSCRCVENAGASQTLSLKIPL
jgi:DUF177 domain-containing protein